MSNYTKTTNFTAKDALTGGDPNKVIKGSEHDTEYSAIENASATKSNKITAGTVNAIIIQSAGGDLVDGTQTLPTGTILGTSDTQTVTNKTFSSCTMDVDNSTITNIADAEIKPSAAIDATKIGNGDVTNTELSRLNSITENVQTALNDGMRGTNNLSELTNTATAWSNLGSPTYNAGLLYLGSGGDGSPASSTRNEAAGEYHYTSLSINSGHTLGISNASGALIIRCTGTVTIAGTINLDGKGGAGGAEASASNGTTGGSGSGGGSGGGGGGSDGSFSGGVGGSSTIRLADLSGGTGGTPTNEGADGSAATQPLINMIKAQVGGDLYSILGAGGASGAHRATTTGGAGGNGGGGVIIIADTIDFQSGAVITCDGSAGVKSTSQVHGSGGGGAGGTVILAAYNITNNGTITVTGAAGGTPTGTAGGGGAGGAGYSLVITL